MKSKLIAMAVLVASFGAGRVVFVNWDSGQVDATLPDSFGALEAYDKSLCTADPCASPAVAVNCEAARRHLDDAGYTNAILREIECTFRIGQRAKDMAADAGFALSVGSDGGVAKYQQIRFVAMRRPGIDGGFAYAIATKDNGWPIEAALVGTFPCAWRNDAGATCGFVDGGEPGLQNTMQAGQWVGAGCWRKSCVEVAGDTSAP